MSTGNGHGLGTGTGTGLGHGVGTGTYFEKILIKLNFSISLFLVH